MKKSSWVLAVGTLVVAGCTHLFFAKGTEEVILEGSGWFYVKAEIDYKYFNEKLDQAIRCVKSSQGYCRVYLKDSPTAKTRMIQVQVGETQEIGAAEYCIATPSIGDYVNDCEPKKGRWAR